jgi:hypothetical protein
MTFAASVHAKAIELIKLSIEMTTAAGSGHPTSAASLAHLVTVLMYHHMRHDPTDPSHPAADRLVLSEGHACPIIYAAAADLGIAIGRDRAAWRPMTRQDALRLRDIESEIDGHPNPAEGFPFFPAATGSLGQGLSIAAGLGLAARRVEMQDARIRRPFWLRLYLAPAYGTSDKRRTPAVEVLAELLGGGQNSLLYRQLVRTLGLAAEVSAAYSPAAVDQTTLAIVAVPAPGVSASDLEQAINREITRIRDGAIDAADVQRVQQKMRAQAIRMRDGTMPAAQAVGAALSTGAALDEIDTWPARIGAVTVADVRVEAKAVLRDEASATGVLVPNKE